MSNLPDIKRRLASVKQTSQITGAMKTVSAAKMRSAHVLYERGASFLRLVTDAAAGIPFDGVLPEPKSGDDVMIVVSSDRGLCGAFDNEVIKLVKQNADESAVIMPIGTVAAGKLGGKYKTDTRFVGCGQPEFGAAIDMADQLLEMYGNGVKRVRIAYTRFAAGTGAPVIKQLLPIACEHGAVGEPYSLEPTEEFVLTTLVPLLLSSTLYAAVAESYAAEQRARYAAMSAASDSADAMIEYLSLEYNRARQATVTEQIIEIAGATAALKESVYHEKGN